MAREIRYQEDLSGQDFRALDLTDAYFGESNLDGTRFADVPNVTFYACTGSPDFSECPDLELAHFRHCTFSGILLPPRAPTTQHDVVGTVLRVSASKLKGKIVQDTLALADYIQTHYAESWADFHEWAAANLSPARKRALAAAAFLAFPDLQTKFDETEP